MRFKCWYCSAEYSDFKGLVSHFEAKHRQRDEHIVLEVTEDMVKRKRQDNNMLGEVAK